MEDSFLEHVCKLDQNSTERKAMEDFWTKAWEGEDLSSYTQDEKYGKIESDASKIALFEELIKMGKIKATVDNLLKIGLNSPCELIVQYGKLPECEIANSENLSKVLICVDAMCKKQRYSNEVVASMKSNLSTIYDKAMDSLYKSINNNLGGHENVNNKTNGNGEKFGKLNKWIKY